MEDKKKLILQAKKEAYKLEQLEKEFKEQSYVHQTKIAEIAVKICTIRHGGISNGIYTLKDYAKDIGLNSCTVQNWVRVYTVVVVKGELKIKSKEDWANCRKVYDLLRNETGIDNKKKGNTGNRSNYKANVPSSRINDLFNEVQEEKPFKFEFVRAKSSAKHLKHILETMDLNIVEDADLLDMMQILDTASDVINNFLTKKQRRKVA